MRTRESGFTVVELITVAILAFFVGSLFLVQSGNAASGSRDSERKRDVNAVYYYLEYVYYPAHKDYPSTLVAKQLPGLDPEVLTDPKGIPVNGREGSLAYSPSGCQQNVCTGYTMTATLENGAPFSQTSLVH